MLNYKNRIKKPREFSSIYKQNQRYFCDYFTLLIQYKSFEIKVPPRFGFVVSKKVGNAVMRNNVKRKLREIIRLLLKENKLKSNFDAVFIAKDRITSIDYANLTAQVEVALQKLNLLNK